jgi:predicted DNA-binding protein with PD1-like motif
LELIALSGTLSRYGMHLHGAVADAEGRVYGGHIMAGCVIRTTAEIAIAPLPHLRLRREPDPATGYLELVVEPLA